MAHTTAAPTLLQRSRKAIIAGLSAGVAAAVPTLLAVWPDGVTGAEAGTVAGAFLAAAVTLWWPTWQVANAKGVTSGS